MPPKADPLPPFSLRLRELREAQGLSAGALAAACAAAGTPLTRQAVEKLERGGRPLLGTAQALAAALGVPLAELAGGGPGR